MRKYIKDYEIVTTEDEKGREKRTVVYRGSIYEADVGALGLIKFKRICLLLAAAIVILQIAAGFVANPGMYAFYVALPYVSVFLPLYLLVDGILRLPKEQRPMHRDEAELSFDRIRKASTFLLIILGVGILGEIVYLAGFASEGQLWEVLYLGLEVAAAAAAYAFLRLQKNVQVRVISDNQHTLE